MDAAPKSKSWLLIFDPSLQSLDGHSYHYDAAIAAAAGECFDRVLVYADRDFLRVAPEGFSVCAVPDFIPFRFLRYIIKRAYPPHVSADSTGSHGSSSMAGDSGTAPAWTVTLWNNLRAMDTAMALKRVLAGLPVSAGDRIHVLIQYVDLYELIAVDLFGALPGKRGSALTTFHLVLRSDPDHTRTDRESAGRFRSRLQKLLASALPRVRLYTDADALTSCYRNFLAIDRGFDVLPIPLATTAHAVSSNRVNPSSNTVRISFLGSSRIERGFGVLPKLLPSFPSHFGKARVHLAVQANRPSEDPIVRQVAQWVEQYAKCPQGDGPEVEFLEGPVSEHVYLSWFARTDILLAPYVSRRYALSTSSVFAEAMHFLVPTIATRGTWIAAQIADAASRGLRIGCIAEDLSAYPTLALRIWEEIESYRTDMGVYLRNWREINNPLNFVHKLLATDDP